MVFKILFTKAFIENKANRDLAIVLMSLRHYPELVLCVIIKNQVFFTALLHNF
jgi:hypothetical protein